MEEKEYKKECPHCKRIMISKSENQLSFNMGLHISACQLNPKNIVKK